MENINLDKFKSAWKNEKKFQEQTLSETDIHKFMKSATKIGAGYRKGLIFDIVFKTTLLLSFCVLLVMLFKQTAVVLLTFLIMITGAGIAWQYKVYKTIPEADSSKYSLKNLLRTYIDFYYQKFIKSIYVSALSGTLFFLSGSMFYLLNKYGEIPVFESDDYVVIGIGVILTYGLSAVMQLVQNNYQVKQLDNCLIEIEEDTISEETIRKYKNNRLKNIIIIGTALILGLLLFLFLIYKFAF